MTNIGRPRWAVVLVCVLAAASQGCGASSSGVPKYGVKSVDSAPDAAKFETDASVPVLWGLQQDGGSVGAAPATAL